MTSASNLAAQCIRECIWAHQEATGSLPERVWVTISLAQYLMENLGLLYETLGEFNLGPLCDFAPLVFEGVKLCDLRSTGLKAVCRA